MEKSQVQPIIKLLKLNFVVFILHDKQKYIGGKCDKAINIYNKTIKIISVFEK